MLYAIALSLVLFCLAAIALDIWTTWPVDYGRTVPTSPADRPSASPSVVEDRRSWGRLARGYGHPWPASIATPSAGLVHRRSTALPAPLTFA